MYVAAKEREKDSGNGRKDASCCSSWSFEIDRTERKVVGWVMCVSVRARQQIGERKKEKVKPIERKRGKVKKSKSLRVQEKNM